MRRSLTVTVLLLTPLAALLAEDPADAFRPWSAFEHLDLRKLARGGVVTRCNSTMKFARGISAQAAFVVAAPPEAAVKALLECDPTKRADSDVYQHRDFQNERDAEFEKIKLEPRIGPVRRLFEAMQKPEDLQLSPEEAARLPASGSIDDKQKFWANLMRERWSRAARQGELGGVANYDTRSEIKSLLAEEPRIVRHFDALLTAFTARTEPAATYYWDVSNVNKTAAIELGAVYLRTAKGQQQLLDVTYYSSSGYLASVTLYELVPVSIEGKPNTLVWQGCLVSAVGLSGGFGVKRQIAALMMVSDLEQTVRTFQSDATGSH